MPDLKPRSDFQKDLEYDKKEMTKTQGGIQSDFKQEQFHGKETVVTDKVRSNADGKPMYTEEAKRMDIMADQFDKNASLMDKRLEAGDKLASDTKSKVCELQSDANKAGEQLSKDQQKHAKNQSKLESKLEKQEEKTMQIARELAQQQEEQRRLEAQRAQEAFQKESEARRLASKLAETRERDRLFAEQKLAELQRGEEELRRKVADLEAHQAKEIHELEIKQKEMHINVEQARKSMQELKNRHDQEKRDLANQQKQLEETRGQLRNFQKLFEDHAKERRDIENQIAQLQKRLAELEFAENEERIKFNELQKAQGYIQQGIQDTQQRIQQEQAALKDREQLLETRKQEEKQIITKSKEELKNEQIALDKARDLAAKTADQRKDIQGDLSRLTKEEREAKAKLSELQQTTHVTVEQKPATIDVFKRERYQTTEPVITETKTEQRCETETCETEEKSSGILGKIKSALGGN